MKKSFILIFLIFFAPFYASAAAAQKASVYDIVKAGLHVAKDRQKIAAENIANHQTINYKKKMPVFQDIYNREIKARLPKKVSEVQDQSAPIYKYEPGHPMANKNGMVAYPNINLLVEQTDYRESKIMYSSLLEILKEDKASKMEILDLLNTR